MSLNIAAYYKSLQFTFTFFFSSFTDYTAHPCTMSLYIIIHVLGFCLFTSYKYYCSNMLILDNLFPKY